MPKLPGTSNLAPAASASTRGSRKLTTTAAADANITRHYPRSFWWYMKWSFIAAQLVLFCSIIVVACIGKGMYDQLQKVVPDTRYISARSKAEPTRVYASDGTTLLAEFKGEMRDFMPIDRLKVWRTRNGKKVLESGNLINATLSIEDARFYSHPGMDAYRIAGAFVANFRNPNGSQQGGSTITEQLAVNIYLTRTKTFGRRLQTALLALQLEKKFSKDEILELYLNEIYYGNRAYGAEAAAQRYFNKSARTLSIAQAAMLAGLPQQPGRLDPFEHYDRAKKRQKLVLRAMLEHKKINWGQYLAAVKDESLKETLLASKQRMREERTATVKWKSPYFVSYVKQYLQKQYDWSDEFLNKAGLKIYTTLDTRMQAVADRVMTERLNDLGGLDLQGALVCIDPHTGRVLAMYGGRDYYHKKRGQFNRATQARRQPGSTFKPYVYATAMEQGYSPDSVVIDKPVKFGSWEPKNFEGKNVHFGALTFRTALAKSNNVAATRILMKLGVPSGVQNVIQKAHMMGITSPMRPYPSLALGSSEITLLENTSGYGVFATRGMRAEPTPIKRVDNYAGETLIDQPSPVRGARVLSQEAGQRMWDMLRYVVTNGTGRPASIRGAEVIGKTGTTSDNKDVWFMGATSQLVTGVWMGYDKPRELYGSAGSTWCAPAWKSFMIQARDIWSRHHKTERMIEDERLKRLQRLKASQYKKYISVSLCRESGLLATRDCPETVKTQFSASAGQLGGAPTQNCTIHGPRPGSRTLDPSGGDTGGVDPGLLSPEVPARQQDESETNPSTVEEDASVDGGADAQARLAPTRDENFRPAVAQIPASEEEPLSVEGGEVYGEDASEVVATVCADSGEKATSRCPVTVQQFFERGREPTRRCRVHR